jgi:branched-chain amino acid transport system ATP-binding protein
MIRALNADKLRIDTGEYVLSVVDLRAQLGVHPVLERIDLDVRRGTRIALVGPAGAGKSLTLACIAGACRPAGGRIRYFGYEIRGRTQEQIARLGIVRTNQQPLPFGDMTVLDTVTVGALLRRPRLARAQAHARQMLAATGLADQATTRFAELGLLDRRRLELARAIATDPQLLLIDDIGADLDAPALAALCDIIAGMSARGMTIVAAARTLDRCPIEPDNVVAINRGKTAETGNIAALDLRP